MEQKQEAPFYEKTLVDTIKETRNHLIDLVQGENFTKNLQKYLTVMAEVGPPFVNYEAEPRQVRQIKDIINALYQAEVIFNHLQSNWEALCNAKLIYNSAVLAAR